MNCIHFYKYVQLRKTTFTPTCLKLVNPLCEIWLGSFQDIKTNKQNNNQPKKPTKIRTKTSLVLLFHTPSQRPHAVLSQNEKSTFTGTTGNVCTTYTTKSQLPNSVSQLSDRDLTQVSKTQLTYRYTQSCSWSPISKTNFSFLSADGSACLSTKQV